MFLTIKDLLVERLQPHPEAKLEVETEPQSEVTTATAEKPKISFFTAIATFFIVLFDRKSNTEERSLNS